MSKGKKTKWDSAGNPKIRPTRPGYKTPAQRERVNEAADYEPGLFDPKKPYKRISVGSGTLGPDLNPAGTKTQKILPSGKLGPGRDISGEPSGRHSYKYKMNPASRKNRSDLSAPAKRTKKGDKIVGYSPSGKTIEKNVEGIRIRESVKKKSPKTAPRPKPEVKATVKKKTGGRIGVGAAMRGFGAVRNR